MVVICEAIMTWRFLVCQLNSNLVLGRSWYCETKRDGSLLWSSTGLPCQRLITCIRRSIPLQASPSSNGRILEVRHSSTRFRPSVVMGGCNFFFILTIEFLFMMTFYTFCTFCTFCTRTHAHPYIGVSENGVSPRYPPTFNRENDDKPLDLGYTLFSEPTYTHKTCMQACRHVGTQHRHKRAHTPTPTPTRTRAQT